MTTKETMTDIQAFRRRFESLAAWGIRIYGLDGHLVDLDEYDDARELSTQGHFTYVSHDETSVTVEVGLPDRDAYREVTLPFTADGDEVERLLLGAIRECEKAEEAITAPETPAEQPQETEGTLDPAMQKFIDHYNALISTPVRPPAPSESSIKPDQGNPESPLRALFWAAHEDGFVVNPNGSAVDIVIEQPIVIGRVEHGKLHDDGYTFRVSNAEQTISVDVFIPHDTRMHAARHSILKALKQAEKALATPETPAAGAWGEDGMTLDEYQQAAAQFATYPKERAFDYLAIGLMGEAGEVGEKYKRVLRGDYPTIRSVRHDIIRELGDVLWYIAQWCNELDFSLEAVAKGNLEKLTNRKRNKTLKGEGDNR